MARVERHLKIIDLITKFDITTQEELVKRLLDIGFNVTQATVSRDIKELGLYKILGENRKYRYVYVNREETEDASVMLNLFKDAVLTMESAQNIIVIKCVSGGASAAGAMIDKLKISDIVGTLAGDDTVLVIVSNILAIKSVLTRLKQFTY